MCGIAGLLKIGDGASFSREQASKTLTLMQTSMAHRGPDGKGLWLSENYPVGFSHRRLAIVDLTDDASQPMCNEDATVWVTYNGEIYNHTTLRKDLTQAGHHFKSHHSDTEVLVHGYEEWGLEGLVKRLDGMFAFAIWDEHKRELSLARDRVGIKPLYFVRQNGEFRFASEIKAILADNKIHRDIEPAALNHFLSFLVAPAPLTMFKGIFKLPAAHTMRVDRHGNIQAKRYWQAVPGRGISKEEVAGLSDSALEDFYIIGIRSRLEKAIEKRMMSDVPFGVFLSGGVDSSANVALMSQLMDRSVETFSVGFKDHQHLNELEYAEKVSKRFQTNHHEVLIDEKDMVSYLDDLVHHQDEPIADWVCIPLYFVSKLARDNGVPVVQVGEGSDEQFCGYNSYLMYLKLHRLFWGKYNRFAPGFLKNIGARISRNIACGTETDRMADLLDRAANNGEIFWSGAHSFWNIHKDRLLNKGAISSPGVEDLANSGLPIEDLYHPDTANWVGRMYLEFDANHPNQDLLTRMIHSEFSLRLPELLLMRVDKISMSTSVEGRVPFLDYKLVEFTMDIPQYWKIKGGESKYLLKKAIKDILPNDIIYRKKMGFSAPMADWLKGEFGKTAELLILNSNINERGFFNLKHINKLFQEHRSGRKNNALHIWTLFNLMSWYDHWIKT